MSNPFSRLRTDTIITLETLLDARLIPGFENCLECYQLVRFFPDNTVSSELIVSIVIDEDEVIIHQTKLTRSRGYSVMVLAAQGAERLTNWFSTQKTLALRDLIIFHQAQGNARAIHIQEGV